MASGRSPQRGFVKHYMGDDMSMAGLQAGHIPYDETAKQAETTKTYQQAATNGNCDVAYQPNPHQILLDRARHCQHLSEGLLALYEALPRKLPYEAADALAELLINSRLGY